MTPRADYGGRVPAVSGGGVVAVVDPASPADRAGLCNGDVIVAVDGHLLRDVIDWQWHTDDASAELTVARQADSAVNVLLEREPGEAWGIGFADLVFDGVRTCRNRCAFCFMTQLPKGLRRALYLRDDDYRLSFLQGNFVTLTNLADADFERIIEQHLSPLYVSVHAVNPAVRRELICAREDRALERMDALLEAGIEVHAQIVLVPGINDGPVLDEALTWLAEREGVASVGIVPLGYTAHQVRFRASYELSLAASAVIEQVEPWQAASAERDGVRWVYLADEFYLNAGIDMPPAVHYDAFPQYENGIGLVRDWIDSTAELAVELAHAAEALTVPVVLVSGTLFAPVLDATIKAWGAEAADHITVLPVPNAFFGGNVSVAGLLCATDLIPAIAATPTDSVVLVPDAVVNAEGLLLDDVAASELSKQSGRDVRLVSCDAAGLLVRLQEVAASPHGLKE